MEKGVIRFTTKSGNKVWLSAVQVEELLGGGREFFQGVRVHWVTDQEYATLTANGLRYAG